MKKTVVLCILDGFGYNGLPSKLYAKETPFISSLYQDYPWCLLEASGPSVGLPIGQMGNSEVGHLTLGAGRVILQDLPRINKALKNDDWTQSADFQNLIQKTKAKNKTCHVLTLLSEGGVHSHIRHSEKIVETLLKHGVKVAVHGISDGRDVNPHDLLKTLSETSLLPHIKTLCGRYFMMDRDKRFDRTAKAYALLTQGKGQEATKWIETVQESYIHDITDEFLQPAVLQGFKGMEDGDSLLMTNFRADRARQILRALLKPDFNDFSRQKTIDFSATLGMVPYSDDLDLFMPALFGNHFVQDTLGEILSKAGLSQLRLAETEKYAHVTFFFNGGLEPAFEKEERILIPSPQVAYYDQKPEMSSYEITENLIDAIASKKYDFILVNYANPDMIGHTGNLDACKATLTALDGQMKALVKLCLETKNELIITADHGNIEEMSAENGPSTYHSMNPVPCFFIGLPPLKNLQKEGSLADIAPTLLKRFALECPKAMTGNSLIEI